jgi:flagellar motility protein MotE (MotC chaperone)
MPTNKLLKKPQPKRRLLKAARLRLMPLTMAMLGLLLVAKLNDVYWNSQQLNELLNTRSAVAQESADEKDSASMPESDASKAAPVAEGEIDTNNDKADDAAEPVVEPKTLGEGKLTIKEIEALKAKKDFQPYTQTELDLLQNLTKRREELDARAKDLEIKASVLAATEKRINDKIVEMKALQAELSTVVAQYKTEQDAEIKSLVKIYESMKPLDAAAIFNEMDMGILLEVIDAMSERKVAPILAGMSPTRARDVTQELAEMRKGRQRLGTAATQALGQ